MSSTKILLLRPGIAPARSWEAEDHLGVRERCAGDLGRHEIKNIPLGISQGDMSEIELSL